MQNNSDLKVRKYSSDSDFKTSFSLLKEVFIGYREGCFLGKQLFIRELKAMFRGSFLGIAWAFIPPLVTAFTWILLNGKKIVNFNSTDVPFPLYVLIGTLLWQVFTEAIVSPSKAMTINRGILTKLNFPRQAILVSAFMEVLFQASLKLVIISIALIYFKVELSFGLVLSIIPFLVFLMLGFSVGIFITPFAMLVKDLLKALPFFLQLVLYLMPVVYPVPEHINSTMDQILFNNPIAIMLCETRDLITGVGTIDFTSFGISAGVVLVMFVISNVVYKVSLSHLVSRLGS